MKKFYFIPKTFIYNSTLHLIWCKIAHKINCLYQDWKHGLKLGTGDWYDKWNPYCWTFREPTESEIEEYGCVNFVARFKGDLSECNDLPF